MVFEIFIHEYCYVIPTLHSSLLILPLSPPAPEHKEEKENLAEKMPGGQCRAEEPRFVMTGHRATRPPHRTPQSPCSPHPGDLRACCCPEEPETDGTRCDEPQTETEKGYGQKEKAVCRS